MRLYRAVSQSELEDIMASGQFRPNPDGFTFGKWFALQHDTAAAWGRWFANRDGHRYYVVETVVSDVFASTLSVVPNLDNIEAAVILEHDQLPSLSILLLSPIPVAS